MALKFLNKKGWHTGSLRNIENVWKAEQKHEAEQKKLEELRKQIHEERERSEFRQLQEQAGLVPRQERLDFLYDSGLAVGKKSSDGGFKALEALPSTNSAAEASTSADADALKQTTAVPGALFEEKPQSANDTWRKLHSDPLLLIRQREQEALARVKNNPVQMAAIRKSVEAKKHKEKERDTKEKRKKHHHSKSKHQKHLSSKRQSDSENDSAEEENRRKSGTHKRSHIQEYSHKAQPDSDDESRERDSRSKKYPKDQKHSSSKLQSNSENDTYEGERKRKVVNNKSSHYDDHYHKSSRYESSATRPHESEYKRRTNGPKLSEEERAHRLREMQVDAELHEEQRWKRLRKAEDDDAREATRSTISGGKNFLEDAHKSVYGAEKGGSTTIEESVRRRTHYSQRTSTAGEGNAFRRR